LLTVNALAAGDGVIVPVQCEYYALEGLAQLLETIEAVHQRLNDRLEVLAIVLTMEDRRNRLSLQVIDEVRKHFPKLVARSRIPRTVRLAEAPSHGRPISVYDPHSKAAKAYADLARELLVRMKAREPIAFAGAIA
jgi:chromosome partitioning protein